MLSLAQQNRWREVYRQRRPDWQPATEVYADLVRSFLMPETRLLDLGCGRGGLVEQLVGNGQKEEGRGQKEERRRKKEEGRRKKEEGSVRYWVGVDPDVASLREHRLVDLPRLAGLSDGLPFRSDSFDLIFCSWLLEHLTRPLSTFAEIGRVLRPGGAFVFITPNGRHPLALLNHSLGRIAEIQGWLVRGLYGRSAADAFPTTYQANTTEQLHRLAQASDLHLSQLHTIPDPSYLAFHPLLFRLMCHVEERLSAERKLHLVGVMQKMS